MTKTAGIMTSGVAALVMGFSSAANADTADQIRMMPEPLYERFEAITDEAERAKALSVYVTTCNDRNGAMRGMNHLVMAGKAVKKYGDKEYAIDSGEMGYSAIRHKNCGDAELLDDIPVDERSEALQVFLQDTAAYFTCSTLTPPKPAGLCGRFNGRFPDAQPLAPGMSGTLQDNLGIFRPKQP